MENSLQGNNLENSLEHSLEDSWLGGSEIESDKQEESK